ncbi:hypothetical protein V498_04442 [Pseudogymnoascus sp. VKM F-4517 (FW-2822)]|nr:hypothetical protein V498_04442 [Pseudogymnoascus sp. VKM F-4517 (FW-2822)]
MAGKKKKQLKSSRTRTPTKILAVKKLTNGSINFQPDAMFKNEAAACAYLGFTDLADLRRLRVSIPVLTAYQILEKNYFNKRRASKHAFSILRDLDSESKKIDFGANLNELSAKYIVPNMSIHSRDYLLAGVIYHLSNTIEDADEMWKDDDAIVAKFEKDMGCTITPFDRGTVILPELGPLAEFEEDVMERYSRTFVLIKHLQHRLSSSMRSYFNAEEYSSVTVLKSSVPVWMRTTTHVGGQSKPNVAPTIPRFQPKEIHLTIDRGQHTKIESLLVEHNESYVLYHSMRLPEGTFDATHDPRFYEHGDEWRDSIRRQLNMYKLRIDISSMSLSSIPVEGIIVYDSVSDAETAKTALWRDVLEILRRDCEQAVFTIQLCALDDVDIDEEDYPYEFRGVPFNLKDAMIIIDQELLSLDSIVTRKQVEDPFSDAPQPVIHPTPAEQAAKRVSQFIENRPIENRPIRLHPAMLFGPDQQQELLQYHNGIDVSTGSGLLQWQKHVLGSIIGNENLSRTRAPPKGVPIIARTEVQRLDEEIATAAIEFEGDSNNVEESLRIQAAITGTIQQTGPYVDTCRTVMGAVFARKHGEAQVLDKVTLSSIPGCNIEFLDSQLTGAMFMVTKTLGYVPIPVDASDEVKEAASTLAGLATRGGLLVDGMGMGKTLTAILFLAYYTLYAPKNAENYRPILILAPGGVVLKQWIDALSKFPQFTVLSCYGDRPVKPQDRVRWVSATAMRDAPEKLDHWPENYKHVWKRTDPRAAATIIISSPETWAMRTLDEEVLYNEALGQDEVVFSSTCQGRFEIAIMDEGHRYRSMGTQMYRALQYLGADYHWFLTGTPVVNRIDDIIGPMTILWTQAKKVLEENDEHREWIESNMKVIGYGVYKAIASMGLCDVRRLLLLDPSRATTLFGADLTTIAANFAIVDELFIIRRTLSSTLRKNDHETISLSTMMPSYTIHTKILQHRPDEALEAQHGHLLHAREYSQAIKEWRGADKAGQRSFPRIVGPLRRMTLLSTSTHLDRLEVTLRKAGLSGRVMDMRGLRERGFNVFDFVELVLRDGDPEFFSTGQSYLEFLTYGSPKSRYILKEIYTYVLPRTPDGKGEKLLLVEDVPLAADFWEMLISLTYVEIAVIHSGLSDEDRVDISHRFNDKDDPLRILVIMYAVSAAGVNLDGACSRVIVLTPAVNYALEAQGFSRLLRVSQVHNVVVVRLIVQNSHDGSREVRQADKAVPDIATRSWSTATKELLVTYLNEQNNDVHMAHDSESGKEILDGRLFLPMQASSILHDDREDTLLRRSKRKSHRPNLLINEMDSGRSEFDNRESEDDENEESLSQYEDEDDDYGSRGLTTTELKKAFQHQAVALQESFSQEEYNLRLLLSLPRDKIYTVADLNDPMILERALRILFCRRIGSSSPVARLGPHITYTMVPAELRKKFGQTLRNTPSVGALRLKWRSLGTLTTPGELKKRGVSQGGLGSQVPKRLKADHTGRESGENANDETFEDE